MYFWTTFYVRHNVASELFFFMLSTSILIAKVILNKENTIEVIKNIKDIWVLGSLIYCYFSCFKDKSVYVLCRSIRPNG